MKKDIIFKATDEKLGVTLRYQYTYEDPPLSPFELGKRAFAEYAKKEGVYFNRDHKILVESMTCAVCNGESGHKIDGSVFVCGPEVPDGLTYIPCSTCEGTGMISEKQLTILHIGAYIRARRREMRMTLRQQAKLLGITPGHLVDLECGRIPGE